MLSPTADHPALRHLVNALRDHHDDRVAAILFYGSCLRSGEPYDGLVDLYLIVDNYRQLYGNGLKAIWNWLLPPNVFYFETPFEEHTVRCKYAVLSIADLKRGTSRWYHSYLWGRFSQPTALTYYKDKDTKTAINNCLVNATLRLLDKTLPSIPAQGDILSLWTDALRLSYRAELRPEAATKTLQLATHNLDYYRNITQQAAPLLSHPLQIASDGRYTATIPTTKRRLNRLGWRLRIAQGKLLSVARLVKAFFTFSGGIDYIAWKLERHSGQKIEVPDRVRRFPLIFIWGFVWRLYRKRVFR